MMGNRGINPNNGIMGQAVESISHPLNWPYFKWNFLVLRKGGIRYF